jgi:hypothetical protein
VSGVMFLAVAPFVAPIAIWVYMLVFAFSSLWFAHYLLSALELHRARQTAAAAEAQAIAAAPVADDASPKLVR